MTIGISSTLNGLYLIDLINSNPNKEKDDKTNNLEDIFSQILDEITENIEKQTEQNLKVQETETNNVRLGPPIGMKIENFEYYP